jgi:transposase
MNMAKKGYRIAKEIKDEILAKIKNEGLSVADAATNYGVHTGTIYNWLGTKATGVVSVLEHNKLKKENEQLKHIIGDLTIKMSIEAKKGLSKGW